MARQIIRQVVQDASFAETIRHDPRKTLLDAGFPEWAVEDFIANDLGLESDVQGYSMDRCAVTSLIWIDGDGMDPQ
jgi:hypothetical protein